MFNIYPIHTTVFSISIRGIFVQFWFCSIPFCHFRCDVVMKNLDLFVSVLLRFEKLVMPKLNSLPVSLLRGKAQCFNDLASQQIKDSGIDWKCEMIWKLSVTPENWGSPDRVEALMHSEGKQHGYSWESNIPSVLKDVEDDRDSVSVSCHLPSLILQPRCNREQGR